MNALIAVFDGSHFLIRLMKDVSCLEIAVLLIGLHAVHDESDRSTWATPGRIRQIIAAQRLASARRVDDFLARLSQTRYVAPTSDPRDRRVNILRPTERLLALDRTYLGALHEPLHFLYPDQWHERIVARDVRMHLALRRTETLALPDSRPPLSDFPAVRLFVTRDAGHMALLLLVQARLARRTDVSCAELAERLGVSRSHIRKLLIDAEAAGYTQRGGRSGSVSNLAPQLWDEFQDYVARMTACRDAIKAAAVEMLQCPGETRRPSSEAICSAVAL